MKRQYKLAASLLASLAVFTSTSEAAITGQWDFNTDLSATIGQPITFLEGETEAAARFGTTTSFGIPDINGQPARVMQFPKIVAGGGFAVPHGASANGGGNGVNQFTIIMDVLYPQDSSGMVRALVNADLFGGGEYLIGGNNGIGAGGGPFDGNVAANTWNRVIFSVDLAATIPVVDKYINGTKVGTQRLEAVDSKWALYYEIFYLLSSELDESALGYIGSLQVRDEKITDGLANALGGAKADGILTGPPPNPYIASVSPSPETARIIGRSTVGPRPEIKIVIEDGTAAVAQNTLALSLDGTPVTPTSITKAGGTTTIIYVPSISLLPLSTHQVNLTFNDTATPPEQLGTQFTFGVGDYLSLPADSVSPIGSGGTRGFLVRTVQAPNEADLNNNQARAIQQLNGTLRDAAGALIENIAAAGATAADVINFDGTGSTYANFPDDMAFPGITDPPNKFATEVIGYLELTAGTHRIGVSTSVDRVDANDDDAFVLFGGTNPRSFFSSVLGQFANNVGGFSAAFNNNEFNIVAPTAGIYPIRLVHWQLGSRTSLEFYSVDPVTGEKMLINDPNNENAIKSYQSVNAARTKAPVVVEASPRPGAAGVDATVPIVVLIEDGAAILNPATIQMTLNGQAVTPTRTKVGTRTTLTYAAPANRTTVTNIVGLTYSDAGAPPNTVTTSWSFNIVAGTGELNMVSGQWDFDAGNLAATVGAPLEYFDGAGGDTQTKTQFGTTTSFGIPDISGAPASVMRVPGDLSNKIGYIMRHGITPNGGGSKVNKYTLVMDVYVDTTGPGAASLINIDDPNNTSDGDVFWQGGQFGQGNGGYNGTGQFTAGAWHRVAWAADLSANPPVVTKFVDGIKQDDWTAGQTLDGRRALNPFAVLFGDGDQDERRVMFVNSIQVREGKLSDAQLVALGGPASSGVQKNVPQTMVAGQWDFNNGNLLATVGAPLEYFDGVGGDTDTKTRFGTTTSFDIPDVDGAPASVIRVPGDLSNKIGYIMRHGISPNGGGSKVNKYTLVMDVYVDTTGPGAASLINIDDPNNTSDGDVFWQGGQFGQGNGGYNGTGQFTAGAWHRVAWAADLSANPPVVTKFVDGIKQDDWTAGQALDGRRALNPFAVLFGDGDQDERRVMYVNSIQIIADKLSDASLALLGGPKNSGIPVSLPATTVAGRWDFNSGNLAATIGAPLEYFDGAGGDSETKTQFGTTASFSIADVGGSPASVIRVPGDLSNKIGYIMRHGITPNGGGSKVNKYTMVMDIYVEPSGPGAASLIQIDDPNNTSDGDIFWQGNNFGQGGGGYNGTGQFTAGAWHRVSWAADLSATPPVVTKYVDGIKQDDWTAGQALDGRRALNPFAVLFGDGDQDERRVMYVDSIQVFGSKLTDSQLGALGSPASGAIPVAVPGSSVKGQWDFDAGNLAATVGRPLEFFDGPGGDTQTKTQYGTTTSFSIPDIEGEVASVLRVPGDLSNKIGYIMRHGITPNGGGSKVNKYTMLMDVYIEPSGPGAASLIQIDDLNNTSDGDIFWQGNNFGQGTGGYVGTGQFTAGAWHRVAWAVDLSATPPVVTKFVDGIKQDDWTAGQTLDGRRALQEYAILFGDGDQDERRVMYVNSVQVREGKLSNADLMALGTTTADGLPLIYGEEAPVVVVEPESPAELTITRSGLNVTISWPADVRGFALESSPAVGPGAVWTPVPGVAGNSVTVQIQTGNRFYRLRK